MTKSERIEPKTSYEIDELRIDSRSLSSPLVRPIANSLGTTAMVDVTWEPDRVLISCTGHLCCNRPEALDRGLSQRQSGTQQSPLPTLPSPHSSMSKTEPTRAIQERSSSENPEIGRTTLLGSRRTREIQSISGKVLGVPCGTVADGSPPNKGHIRRMHRRPTTRTKVRAF